MTGGGANHEIDYLIVGAGAVGLAFADVLLAEDKDATIAIVDRHSAPGGHWNDAYPFVRLHQPSAFYGVESLPLGQDRIDEDGPNSGFYELAGVGELLAYFEHALRAILATGRATYLPSSDHLGEGRVRKLFSGEERQFTVRRRIVDATFYETSVPSTHTPKFEIAAGARMATPAQLPGLVQRPDTIPAHFAILGGGKTAMDCGVWLLQQGVRPEAISWVRPRESWLINRRFTQPGLDFFEASLDNQLALMRAAVDAEAARDIFHRLEPEGYMLRIDQSVEPTKFFFATISTGEVELLRQIERVVRFGHVRRIEPGRMIGESGEESVPEDTLFIDCTASAVRAKPGRPLFADGLITLQPLQAPLVTMSAAVTAWLEVHRDTDEARNALATPVALADSIAHYPVVLLGNAMNRMRWMQEPDLAKWLGRSRLDPMARTIRQVRKERPDLLGLLDGFRSTAQEAGPHLFRLAQQAPPIPA